MAATTPTGASDVASKHADNYIVGDRIPTNPTPLSAPQEAQVRELYYRRVKDKCADEIKEFAACALNRTLSMVFACRPQKLAMNHCMLQYQNQESMDAARAEWFALAGERKRQREEHKRKQEEAKKKHHEWWGLDEQGRTVAMREAMERVEAEERERDLMERKGVKGRRS
ncbi:hypothetical protein GQ43DRAFT_483836 [Delitschia confertaspora ATCC 74209]|uniref:COX assembly mitochondrial protein n=1 Tax=Delitschia confertaspora ATCC 74209 TaxID=1513339 RepID=A0A9P4MM25_9PLEO|nr:hypothetical protein GQ43DRAFT_483836 [Delitschia confertaspora ATCC 74209]